MFNKAAAKTQTPISTHQGGLDSICQVMIKRLIVRPDVDARCVVYHGAMLPNTRLISCRGEIASFVRTTEQMVPSEVAADRVKANFIREFSTYLIIDLTYHRLIVKNSLPRIQIVKR